MGRLATVGHPKVLKTGKKVKRRPKKRCAVCGQDIVPDPLVDPGNPPHRHEARTTAHPPCVRHRMVTVAPRPPSRSAPRTLKKKMQL